LRIEDSSIDLKKLKGKYRGSFRIRKGDTRIIFSISKEDELTVLVHDIDFRGNVYK
jgi:mRNA-degrading endonuclease RelE of RelBE toxin-antitoxin system